MRSVDQQHHSYLGYSLRVDGTIDGLSRIFTVGIGKAPQAQKSIQACYSVEGLCTPGENPALEPVEHYKVSKFKIAARSHP